MPHLPAPRIAPDVRHVKVADGAALASLCVLARGLGWEVVSTRVQRDGLAVVLSR